jgi:hypothetical protein
MFGEEITPTPKKPAAPLPSERITAVKEKKDPMDWALGKAFQKPAGHVDVESYPPDIKEIIREFSKVWGIAPPRKVGKKAGEFGQWIEGARQLKDALGEFGPIILQEVRALIIAEKYDDKVSWPGACLKAARKVAGKKREEQITAQSFERPDPNDPETIRIKADLARIKAEKRAREASKSTAQSTSPS